MKRYVVLGVNDNPKYLYYLPLINWAWRRFGWEVVLLNVGSEIRGCKFDDPIREANKNNNCPWTTEWIDVNDYESPIAYKSETVAQVSRLYACGIMKEGLLMTSDADMLPLSNYWNPSELNVTCYGRDLTDYHYPICYIAMTSIKWLQVMMITDDYTRDIKQDLDSRPKNSNAWLWDQDIITERLKKYKIIFRVDRGIDRRTGYPIGRVDRSNWTLDHKTFIDAHLPHDVLTNDKSFHNVMQLLHTVWPKEDWKWWLTYTKEFKKLL